MADTTNTSVPARLLRPLRRKGERVAAYTVIYDGVEIGKVVRGRRYWYGAYTYGAYDIARGIAFGSPKSAAADLAATHDRRRVP